MGLFEEIQSLRKVLSPPFDYTRGILQAIGFKEFHPYLEALASPESSSDLLDSLKTQGLQDMKRHTRQYARKQVGWIQKKLMPQLTGPHMACMRLDANGTFSKIFTHKQISRNGNSACAIPPFKRLKVCASNRLIPRQTFFSPTPLLCQTCPLLSKSRH